MAVIETLGIVLGLAVMALMALTPTLVALNDRYPAEARKTPENAATQPAQVPSVRTTLLGHQIPAHR
jgi:hypothetical protein